MQLVIDTLAEVWFAIVILHNVQTLVDGFFVLQREHQPATQHTPPHRCHRMVNHIEQRLTVVLHRRDKLQRTHRKLIQTYVFVFFDTGNRGDMCYLRMQRLLQILQDGTSSNNTTLQVIDAKTLQRLHVEMLVQLLMRRLLSKYPVVKFEGDEAIAKVTFEVMLATPIVEHLLRLEVTYQFLNIVVSPLAYQEFTCRDVKEADTTRRLAKMHSA